MLGGIKARLLLLSRDSQGAKELEDVKEGDHIDRDPGKDDEDADDLGRKEDSSTSIVEKSVGVVDGVCSSRVGDLVGRGAGLKASVGSSVSLQDVLLLGHEADPEEAPCAAEAVHGCRHERVVDLELQEQDADTFKDDSGDRSADDGCPRLEDVAATRDGDKATEDAVAACQEVPGLVPEECDCKSHEASSSSSKGGGDGSSTHNHSSIRSVDEDH